MFLWSVNVIHIKMILCLRYLIRIPRTEYPDDEVGRVTCLRTSIPGTKGGYKPENVPSTIRNFMQYSVSFRATVVPQYSPPLTASPQSRRCFQVPLPSFSNIPPFISPVPRAAVLRGVGGSTVFKRCCPSYPN